MHHPVYSPVHHHPNGDESFFQAHAENTSSLLDCQRETEREVERELLAKLRANLEAIEADKWMYEKPRYS